MKGFSAERYIILGVVVLVTIAIIFSSGIANRLFASFSPSLQLAQPIGEVGDVGGVVPLPIGMPLTVPRCGEYTSYNLKYACVIGPNPSVQIWVEKDKLCSERNTFRAKCKADALAKQTNDLGACISGAMQTCNSQLSKGPGHNFCNPSVKKYCGLDPIKNPGACFLTMPSKYDPCKSSDPTYDPEPFIFNENYVNKTDIIMAKWTCDFTCKFSTSAAEAVITGSRSIGCTTCAMP